LSFTDKLEEQAQLSLR